jgi:hypothetical protein
MHPPALYLAAPFASQGSKAATFLKYKIQNTLVSDLDLRDILQVFVEMERQQTYDVIADPQLMDLLRSRVQKADDKNWGSYMRELYANLEPGAYSG